MLDVYADQEKFGKQVGGDIISNKKTFLLLKALELANEEQRKKLEHWIEQTDFNPAEKVEAVTAIYDEIGIKELTLAKMNEYFDRGFRALERIDVAQDRKAGLKSFAHYLIDRDK